MLQLKRYQVRGLPGEVNRASFNGRIVDYWAPEGGSDHLLVAHDGQNIFDRRTASFVYTWKLGQNSLRVSREIGLKPPTIIAIFHSSSKSDPNGRSKDLCPEDPFRSGMRPLTQSKITSDELRGNEYLREIFEQIVPTITSLTDCRALPRSTAMVGSSMGGLATLYAMTRYSDRFHTALALSPHWVLAGNPLVDWMIPKLPNNETIKVWMSRGTKGLDASYLPYQDRADALMRHLSWGARYSSKVYHRTSHNERSWSSYIAEPLRFWLNS
jgi:predicted alpha/beta superfamily hydrolase